MNRVISLYSWKGVGGMGCVAVLAITRDALYFSNDGSRSAFEDLSGDVSSRDLDGVFPDDTKVIQISDILKIRLVEEGAHFRIFHKKGKLVIPFGDGEQEDAAKYFKGLVNELDGFSVTKDERATRMENLDLPLACLTTTLLMGGLCVYLLYGERVDPTSQPAFIAMLLQVVVKFLGEIVVWVLILIGMWLSIKWLIKRWRRPLVAFIADKRVPK